MLIILITFCYSVVNYSLSAVCLRVSRTPWQVGSVPATSVGRLFRPGFNPGGLGLRIGVTCENVSRRTKTKGCIGELDSFPALVLGR